MKTRKRRIKFTNWTIPLMYIAVTFIVSLTFPRFEHYMLPWMVSSMSAPAAMAICSSIASGMITLTGIVFSLTFVMVQFSATAYSPRLVLWVAREPVVSHALGLFIATSLYALSMLAWVDRNGTGKVPFISQWLVVVMVLVSMGFFVALIERVGMLRVNRMLIYTGNQGRQALEKIYLNPRLKSTAIKREEFQDLPITKTITYIGRPRAVQTINVTALLDLAINSGGLIEVVAAVGDTAIESTPLLHVRETRQSIDDAALRAAIELGNERTFEQDPKYAIRLVVDIAIKALSPAINDPTTAVQALDQIEDLLLRLGRSNLEIGAARDNNGTLRLVIPFPEWVDFLRLALDEIRSYGANSVQVMRRMKALIANLLSILPPERHPALRKWEERLHGSIRHAFKDDPDEQQDASIADRQGLGLAG